MLPPACQRTNQIFSETYHNISRIAELANGTGADVFVYSEGDGDLILANADVITDFDDGTDLIGLSGGLAFADLTVSDGADTTISVTATGEILTLVQGVPDNLLTSADFTTV